MEYIGRLILMLMLPFVLILVIVGVILVIVGAFKRCPHCRKAFALKEFDSTLINKEKTSKLEKHYSYNKKGERTLSFFYNCPNPASAPPSASVSVAKVGCPSGGCPRLPGHTAKSGFFNTVLPIFVPTE